MHGMAFDTIYGSDDKSRHGTYRGCDGVPVCIHTIVQMIQTRFLKSLEACPGLLSGEAASNQYDNSYQSTPSKLKTM